MRYFGIYIGIKDRLFTYCNEDNVLEGNGLNVSVGSVVQVKFRNRDKIGIVVTEQEKPNFKVLSIQQLLLQLDAKLVELALWLDRYYLLGLERAFSLIAPKNIFMQSNFFKQGIYSEEIEQYFSGRDLVSKRSISSKFGKERVAQLLKEGFLLAESSFSLRKAEVESCVNLNLAELNINQKIAFDKIDKTDNTFFLLKGVTGSGKTEIYMHIIQKCYERGEGVIFLLPEITLASHISEKLKNLNVSILHSSISKKALAEEWIKLANGEKRVVLGARSAIFAPVQNLKYIILDEEHDDSYKQDTLPRYDARAVAMKRAQLAKAKLVLGSATPSIEREYNVKLGKIVLAELKERYNNYSMPEIELIDMRESREILSKKLLDEISETIGRKEQVMVMLNRKGYANTMQCICGHVEECKNCSVSLVFYKTENILKCNYCSYSRPYDLMCSSCGLFSRTTKGLGTESLEELIKQHFSNVIRLDGEVKRKNSDDILRDFAKGKYDILIGTKIISKGLDFKNVTLVAVVNADALLHFPDFRAAEKSFQFLTQAAGRSGRSEKKGKVLIQTLSPEHYAIQNINKYEEFYKEEIAFREELNYPPFSKTLNIVISSKDESKAKEIAKEIAHEFERNGISLGKSKAPIYLMKNHYRYNLFIKQSNLDKVREICRKIKRKEVEFDFDPINLV